MANDEARSRASVELRDDLRKMTKDLSHQWPKGTVEVPEYLQVAVAGVHKEITTNGDVGDGIGQ